MGISDDLEEGSSGRASSKNVPDVNEGSFHSTTEGHVEVLEEDDPPKQQLKQPMDPLRHKYGKLNRLQLTGIPVAVASTMWNKTEAVAADTAEGIEHIADIRNWRCITISLLMTFFLYFAMVGFLACLCFLCYLFASKRSE